MAKSASASKTEALTKTAAKKRQITIDLTEEQIKAFEEQYQKLNPSQAVELIFINGKQRTSKLKIAGYSYHGNTCCV